MARYSWDRDDVKGSADIRIAVAEEIQVRITAQRIITSHCRMRKLGSGDSLGDQTEMRSDDDQYWDGIRLDLSDTTLIHFDAARCHFSNVDFTRARFRGFTLFIKSTFSEPVWFDACLFEHAVFDGAVFSGDTRFFDAVFTEWAGFMHVAFKADITFNAATFGGVVDFRGVKWANDPADDVLLLTAASHTDVDVRAVRAWPPGWQEVVSKRDPSRAVIERIAEAPSDEPADANDPE